VAARGCTAPNPWIAVVLCTYIYYGGVGTLFVYKVGESGSISRFAYGLGVCVFGGLWNNSFPIYCILEVIGGVFEVTL
jgi:hypothetical protein